MQRDEPACGKTPWLAAVILVVVSLGIALLLAETVIRLFYPQRLYYNVSQWDEYVGFRSIPNTESTQHHSEYVMHIRINSRGLRDREYVLDKPPNTIRIGIFGDSFTFGEGVEVEETYPKVLEQRIAGDPLIDKLGWKVEVLNFGIGKTGTAHQLAWYQKEGFRYGLDVVILGFFARNDFDDNLAGVFFLQNGELIHNPAAYSSVRKIQSIVYKIPGYRWIVEHSHLANIARKVATTLDDRRRAAAAAIPAEAKVDRDAYAVELTLRLIEQFVHEAKVNGSDFLILSIPARGQRPLRDYVRSEDIPRWVGQLARLQDALLQKGITLVDFVPTFANLPVADYYYEVDGHWRAAGHKILAEGLHKHLEGEVRALAEAPTARLDDIAGKHTGGK